MTTYTQRGYTVEVGFAVGRPPHGPVDPDTFRHSREEVEELIRQREEFEREFSELFVRSEPSDEPLFPRDLHSQEPRNRGIVGSIRVSGRLFARPRVMPWREWEINLGDRIY